MKKILFALIISALSIHVIRSQEIIWKYSEELPHGVQRTFVEIDSENNVYTAFSGMDYLKIIKFDPNGNLQWSIVDTAWRSFYDFKVSNSGTIYATGSIETGINTYDCIVAAYSPQGIQQFESTYSVTNFSGDAGNRITFDDAGNIYVSGMSLTGTTTSLFTLKMNNGGSIEWVQLKDFITPVVPYNLILDDEGNVYSAGFDAYVGDSINSFIVKYGNDGQQLFDNTYLIDGYKSFYGAALFFDLDQNLILAGMIATNNNTGGCCLKIDADGNVMWERLILAGYHDMAILCGDIDRSGNIILGGQITYDDADAYYGKFSADGNLIWENVYSGPVGSIDECRNLVVDDDQCYFSFSEDGITSKRNFTILKTDLSGNTIWDIFYDGPAHLNDNLKEIIIDNNNEIVVMAQTEEVALHYYATLIKYSNPLSVSENNTSYNPNLVLFPNPAYQVVTISTAEGYAIDELTIYTLAGQQVLHERLLSGTIDISHLQPGMYIVEVTGEGRKIRRKLLIE